MATTLSTTLLLPSALNIKKEINASAGSDYTASRSYYFAGNNCGYYTEPTAAGTYPTAIILHGSGADCSSWMAQQMPDAMEYWTKNGYLEPMNIIMPWIAHQAKNDDWGVYAHRDFAMNYSDDLAQNIENITGKADTKKYQTAIAGYSMGGCDALTAAALYPELYKEVGAISSSFTFYKYDDPKNEWSNFHSVSEMNFSKDLNCYITYGSVEAEKDAENIFKPSADCYYNILKKDFGVKTVTGPIVCKNSSWGKHGNRLFFREIFMYLYYLQTGKVASEELAEKACKDCYKDYGTWKTLSKPTTHDPSKKDPVTTPLTVSDTASTKTKVTFGDPYTLSVTAKGGNSANYTYDWQFSCDNTTYTSTGRKDQNGKSLNGKASLPIADATRDIYYRCVVSDGTTKVISKPIFISVAPKIKSISSSGKGVALVPDATYTIKVVAEGQNLSYKWEYSLDGKNWVKSTNKGYNTDTATYINRKENHVQAIYYRCTVTSASTSTTVTIRLGK